MGIFCGFPVYPFHKVNFTGAAPPPPLISMDQHFAVRLAAQFVATVGAGWSVRMIALRKGRWLIWVGTIVALICGYAAIALLY